MLQSACTPVYIRECLLYLHTPHVPSVHTGGSGSGVVTCMQDQRGDLNIVTPGRDLWTNQDASRARRRVLQAAQVVDNRRHLVLRVEPNLI